MTISKGTQYITDPNTIPVDSSTGASQTLQTALNSRSAQYPDETSLRLIDGSLLSDGDVVIAAGRIFKWDSSSTLEDNGETSIKLDNTTTGRFLRQNINNDRVQEILKTSFVRKMRAARSGGIWQSNPQINILGDSISQGAYSVDIYRDNWTNIFKRNVNADKDATNFGFVSIWDNATDAEYPSQDVHVVTTTGSWFLEDGLGASGSISGLYRRSNDVAGSKLTIVVPVFQKTFAVFYGKASGNGSFDITRNGATLATIDSDSDVTGSPGGYNKSQEHNLIDQGDGYCTIELIKNDSNVVDIIGLSYENNPDGFMVNNFSHSGRRLNEVSEDVIRVATQGSEMLILALGHNDRADADTDDNIYNRVNLRLDWVKEYSELNKVPVMVLDFCWGVSLSDSRTRRSLRDTQYNIEGCTYVPFPDYFSTFGVEDFSYYGPGDLAMFEDGSHPRPSGHKVIGEVVSQIFGCSNTSSETLCEFQDWFPVNLPSPLANNDTAYPFVSAYRVDKGKIQVKVRLKNSGGGDIPAGEYVLVSLGGSHVQSDSIVMVVDSPETEPDRYIPAIIRLKSNGDVVLKTKGSGNTALLTGSATLPLGAT